ncbi:hypothetical protein BDFB_014899, partial [Asbolus verrucosus]
TLKRELISRLSTSQERKTKRLLEQEEIGDRTPLTPSQFLRHLKDLAGPTVPETLIRTLWTSRLPVQMQAILATQEKNKLDDVANLADKIQETQGPRVATMAANNNDDVMTSLLKQVEALTIQVVAL